MEKFERNHIDSLMPVVPNDLFCLRAGAAVIVVDFHKFFLLLAIHIPPLMSFVIEY